MTNQKEDKRKPSNELLALLALNVKSLRKSKNLSQEKLGELCDFHSTFISLIERQQRNVTISTLEVIAKALEVETHELIKYREESTDNV